MVDLRAKPFYLNEEQIAWVHHSIDAMSLEEKSGQLFTIMTYLPGVQEARIKKELDSFHQGGLRWQRKTAEETYEQNRLYQLHSHIPLLIAANCDTGGAECVPEGTYVATAAQATAGGDEITAYRMGLVSAREAGSVGANWLFNPVCDIYQNWRNTIVNTRSFGENPDTVLKMARAYIRGVRDSGFPMACTAKHFPGDGTEERDQHLVIGCNDLSVEDWECSFGKVYRGLIEDGIEAVMVGHICQRALSRKYRPGIRDREIMPATLAPELLEDVLRQELGFNGLIVTDATQMIGFNAAMPREQALPAAIAAGCDMILFTNDTAEDFGYLRAGVEKGVISTQRLREALERILGLKAKLGLTRNDTFPARDRMDRYLGCQDHISFRREAAERCMTLVKDTQKLLPVKPEGKRVFLVYARNIPNTRAYDGDPVKANLKAELEQAGFAVDLCPSFYDLEAEHGVSLRNFLTMMDKGSREAFKRKYDLVLLALNFTGYAQTNEVRVTWSTDHSVDQPWYLAEVPTVVVSLNLTNHLIDVPQAKTFINAYGSKPENLHALVEKLTGKTEFTGKAEDNVFCGRWETRL